MAKKKDAVQEPATGGFPGYARGTQLFNAWANALCASTDGWNDLWGKMRRGEANPADWTRAVVASVDSSAAFVGQLLRPDGGAGGPPWVVLPFVPTSEVERRLSQTIDVNFKAKVPLTLLGGNPQGAPSVTVRAIDAHTLGVLMTPDQVDEVRQAGQYIALVFAPGTSEPLAIVTLHVAPPKEAKAEARGEAEAKVLPKKAAKKKAVKKKAVKKKAVKKKA